MICRIGDAKRAAPVPNPNPIVYARSKGVRQARGNGVIKEWVEHDGNARTIMGTAVTAHPNHIDYAIDPAGGKIGLPIPLLFDHGFEKWTGDFLARKDCDNGRIGKVVTLWRAADRIRVKAILDDTPAADYAWRLICSGAVRHFSALPKDMFLGGVTDGISFYKTWHLPELSITRKCENPEAVFERVVTISR